MSDRRIEGSTTYAQPLDNGRTRYRVTIEFSNDYESSDALDTDHPSMWDWVDLLAEPDARVLSWVEDSNPGWQAGDGPTSQPYDPAEYVRLLRVASAALAQARAYGDTRDRWRPAYSDLILLESMDGWLPEDDASFILNCTPDEAMVKVIEANEGVTLPDQVWEFYDDDVEQNLTKVGIFRSREEGDDE